MDDVFPALLLGSLVYLVYLETLLFQVSFYSYFNSYMLAVTISVMETNLGIVAPAVTISVMDL